jgi:cytochrome c
MFRETTMNLKFAIIAVLAIAAAPAFAAGDPAKGEAVFKQCQTCHSVVDADGKLLAGKGAKVGPSLFGVFGRQAGTYAGFKYGESMVAAGVGGLIWDEPNFVEYVQDPAAFLKKKDADNGAKAKMMFKLKDAASAEDVYSYLIQFSPAAAAPAADAAAPAPSN